MVSVVRVGGQISPNNCEFYGLSTDTKPQDGVPNGSSFYEMDTKKLFLFDEENKVWYEQ